MSGLHLEKQIVLLFLQGRSVAEIATHLATHRLTIENVLREAFQQTLKCVETQQADTRIARALESHG